MWSTRSVVQAIVDLWSRVVCGYTNPHARYVHKASSSDLFQLRRFTDVCWVERWQRDPAAQPVALALEHHDLGAIKHAVDGGVGQHRIRKHLTPFLDIAA